MKNRKFMDNKDPVSENFKKFDKLAAAVIKKWAIIIMVIGAIIGIIVASLATDLNDNLASNVTVDAFGFIFDVDEDCFWVSPFMIFAYVSSLFDLMVAIICGILVLVFKNMEIKCKLLDNTYQSMLILKYIAETTLPDNEKIEAANYNVHKGTCEICHQQDIIIRKCMLNGETENKLHNLCEKCIVDLGAKPMT